MNLLVSVGGSIYTRYITISPFSNSFADWKLEQLFENQSVVEYWESFASHAFENTTQSVYTHCVLLKPNGAPIPATFCFSIRRDIFDLPSIVIGMFSLSLGFFLSC
jgi:hypothetical protein